MVYLNSGNGLFPFPSTLFFLYMIMNYVRIFGCVQGLALFVIIIFALGIFIQGIKQELEEISVFLKALD